MEDESPTRAFLLAPFPAPHYDQSYDQNTDKL